MPSNYRKRKIRIQGKTYESVKACQEKTGLSSYRIYKLLGQR